MDRRHDSNTADLVVMALLMRAVFTRRMALTYARLCGISCRLIGAVFERPMRAVRGRHAYFLKNTDRRRYARPNFEGR